MTYTKDKPPLPETSEELRARIPGWGVDLDPAVRPSVPKLSYREDLTGAHWDFPERQPELTPRERSIEHGMLPPVFGTTAPLHGVSGALRRLAYRRYSEATLAHWLLLMAGDRVEAWGAHARSLVSLRPDDPVTETGVRAEVSGSGLSSRLGHDRADPRHHVVDPVVVAGPWVLVAGGAVLAGRALLRRRG
ncbi:MAG TPA: hypothetical protein VNU66_06185 [Mycobacteriales bacterium]|nr:hypothetical protein [Mycobacteriales bacterium]